MHDYVLIYSGLFLYFANSISQSCSLSGGFVPSNDHSVIDSPDFVSRVNPPIVTIPAMSAAVVRNVPVINFFADDVCVLSWCVSVECGRKRCKRKVDVDVDVNFEVKDLCEWERKERKKMEGMKIGGIFFFVCVCLSGDV